MNILLAVVVQILVDVELHSLGHSPHKVQADVALVLGLVHDVQPNGSEELQLHQAADLTVYVSRGVNLLFNNFVEDSQQPFQWEWFWACELRVQFFSLDFIEVIVFLCLP